MPVVRNGEATVGVDVLFLRPGAPGVVMNHGDLDNRLATIFDALKVPKSVNEFGRAVPVPDAGEVPFYCLLEDDKLITRVGVDTDILLEPVEGKAEIETNDVRLIIAIDIHPLSIGNPRF